MIINTYDVGAGIVVDYVYTSPDEINIFLLVNCNSLCVRILCDGHTPKLKRRRVSIAQVKYRVIDEANRMPSEHGSGTWFLQPTKGHIFAGIK